MALTIWSKSVVCNGFDHKLKVCGLQLFLTIRAKAAFNDSFLGGQLYKVFLVFLHTYREEKSVGERGRESDYYGDFYR